MAAAREKPSLMDFTVIALSPLLIMAMVGSLVFFLVEILYVGQYENRLLYTLFFFVAGIVLVARISIELDPRRAMLYGLALGAASLVALQTYLKYEPGGPLAPVAGLVNVLLMALVWWSAHKLTWDCTHIDDRRESSDRGLLAAAGVEKRDGSRGKERARAAAREAPDVVEDVELTDERADGSKIGLLERYRRHRLRQRRKPHTPGLWVIYFALAALPIFGLGQSLIPADDAVRRAYAFRLMLIYVGSGMGLLMTTSFLGLRRYLRQRNVGMPAAMTGLWLTLGTALILGFLAVGALLPRPHSETPLFGLSRGTSSEREASEHAVRRDSAGKGKGAAGEQGKSGDGKATGSKGDPGGKGKGKGKSGSGGKGKSKSGSGKKAEKGKNSGGDRGEKGSGDEQKQEDRDQEEGKSSDEGASGSSGSDSTDQESENEATSEGSTSSSSSTLGAVAERVGTFLKWAVFALIALVVLLILFRGGLGWLANFVPWARRWLDAWNRWWQRLFGRGAAAEGAGAGEEGAAEPEAPPVPFAAYANPFADGSAGGRPLEELVRYSFAALEAWARDRGEPRRPDETPLEFASRLTDAFPALDQSAQRLGVLYARLAYAGRGLPGQARAVLEQFWERAEAAYAQPLSA